MASHDTHPDPFLTDDENAPLTEEEIKRLRPAGEVFAEQGITPPRPVGRPLAEKPKVRVTMRLDVDVLEHFKADGKGWQTRMNAALREKAELDET